MMTCIYRI